jgi:predicted nucleic acid-binding protein
VTSVFCDTSVLIRYLAEDDIPRAVAAAALIDSDTTLVISTGVMLEAIHVLRTEYQVSNPVLAQALIGLLSRPNVQLTDADKSGVIAAIYWTRDASARRIPDAIIAAAARQARVDYIATFDERMSSPTVPVRML